MTPDQQDHREPPVKLDQLVLLVPGACRVVLAHLVLWEPLEQRDRLASLDSRVSLGLLDHRVVRDLEATLAALEYRVQLVHLVQLVQLEALEEQDTLVLKVFVETLVLLDLTDRWVPWVQLVRLELQELMEVKEFVVYLETLVLLAVLGHQELQEPLVVPEPRVQLDSLVSRVRLVRLVPLAPLEPQDLEA